MKKINLPTFEKWIKDGKVECLTDLKIGYVFVRWCKTGKREYVEIENVKYSGTVNLKEMEI